MQTDHQCGSASSTSHIAHRTLHIGFTLVEMLGSLALTALMMAALLSVITSVQRPLATDASDTAPSPLWVEHMFATMELDLANAESVSVTPVPGSAAQVVIQGWRDLDVASSATQRLPVTITYHVKRVGEQTYLMRRQHMRVASIGGGDTTELVAGGVTALKIERITPSPAERNMAASTAAVSPGMSGPWRLTLSVAPSISAQPFTRIWIHP